MKKRKNKANKRIVTPGPDLPPVSFATNYKYF